MEHGLRLKLVMLLLKIPDIEDFATRTDLLTGLPNRFSLARSQTSAQTDISRLIDQLDPLYLQTGQWALSLLIENALVRLSQTTTGMELEHLHQLLISSAQRIKTTANSPLPTTSLPPAFPERPGFGGDGNLNSCPDKTERKAIFNQGQENEALREPIEIAIIAAPEDARYLQQVLAAIEGILQFVERKELISIWHRAMIPPGSITSQVIKEHIQAAHIILVLMSTDLLANNFYNEPGNHMAALIQRSTRPDVQVIPVLIRPCSWKFSPFKVLEPQPADEIPLTLSQHKDQTLQEIAEAVLASVRKMNEASLVNLSPPSGGETF